ncbi:hypothetical protein [Streptomyces sp. NPDC059142]|uniref:hypothetical protein n=1 Tax=Streptomyces sp. NPDC059142 TaxID=3346739 RepID=UPI0036958AF0
MNDLTTAPTPQATPVSPGQLELFRVRTRPHITLDYARPDGSPLTDADFDHLARIARAAITRKGD